MKNNHLTIIALAALVLAIVASPCRTSAQSVSNKDKIINGKVTGGRSEDLKAKMLDSVKYYLPEFKSGAIAFKNGDISRGVLNVSTVSQKVMFIDTEGAVLELANDKDVKLMSVGRITFIKHKEQYVQVIKSIQGLDLGVTKKVSFLEPEKQGAYGTASVTAAVSTYSSYQTEGRAFDLEKNITTPFIYKEYLTLHRNGKFYHPDKKTFLKLYADKKAEIERYVSESKMDFDSSADLMALMDFIKSL